MYERILLHRSKGKMGVKVRVDILTSEQLFPRKAIADLRHWEEL